jgi:hypothetical protein
MPGARHARPLRGGRSVSSAAGNCQIPTVSVSVPGSPGPNFESQWGRLCRAIVGGPGDTGTWVDRVGRGPGVCGVRIPGNRQAGAFAPASRYRNHDIGSVSSSPDLNFRSQWGRLCGAVFSKPGSRKKIFSPENGAHGRGSPRGPGYLAFLPTAHRTTQSIP